ncbi:MAG: T9SS type A sorting domain-containing protein [Bacteroidota bacterium]
MRKFYLYLFILISGVGCSHSALYGQKAVTQTKELSDRPTIKVYPNPARDHFMLRVNDVEVGAVSVTDIVGKEIIRFDAKDDHNYDISTLNQGIYLVRVYDRKDELVKALRLSKS